MSSPFIPLLDLPIIGRISTLSADPVTNPKKHCLSPTSQPEQIKRIRQSSENREAEAPASNQQRTRELAKIPQNIWERVAAWVTPEDRQNMRLVSHGFKQVVDAVIQEVEVTQWTELGQAIQTYQTGGIRFLKLIGDSFTAKHLEKITPAVKNLNLSRCNLFTVDLSQAKTLKHFEHIQGLVINADEDIHDDFAFLEKFPNLTELIINGRSRQFLTKKCSEKISSLAKLISLKLVGMRMSKEAFTGFEKLTELEELALDGCGGLKLENFKQLGSLPNLKILALYAVKIPAGAFLCLQASTQLHSLVLDSCIGLTQECFDQISVFTHLKSLKLIDLDIPLGAFAGFQKLIWLDELVLDKCKQLKPEHFKYFGVLFPHLKELELHDIRIPKNAFACFATMTELVRLIICECENLTSAHFKQIEYLTHLETLELEGQIIPTGAFAGFEKLTKLNSLELLECLSLTKEHFDRIGLLCNLASLTLYEIEMPTNAFAGFQDFTKLRSLVLNGCIGLTIDDFNQIGSFTYLKSLQLIRLPLLPDACAFFKKLKQLYELVLWACYKRGESPYFWKQSALTSEYFQHIGYLTNLSVLKLRGMEIAEEAFANCLKLPKLYTVDSSSTRFSQELLNYLTDKSSSHPRALSLPALVPVPERKVKICV